MPIRVLCEKAFLLKIYSKLQEAFLLHFAIFQISCKSDFSFQVDKLVDQLHEKLGQITCAQTRTGSLRCVRTLASHHLLSVLNTLLGYPLPLDQ